MDNLFKKCMVFTDIHFGKKNNDRNHNIDCENFVNWAISIGKKRDIDTLIFLGDWHDNRQSLHLSTLDYSLKSIERLSENFENFYFIPGNHDLYYKEKREISSVIIAKNFNNIKIINDFAHMGNVTLCPWLVGEEWKKIPEYAKKSDYMFGHFEIPKFLMNAQVEMPDHGEINIDHFNDVTYYAFSGHFHKRQSKGKVSYIGNCFPHNFSDAWDSDRGLMILEWGKPPEFISWPDQPTYKVLTLSALLEDMFTVLDSRVYCKVDIDINLNYEQIQVIKDTLQGIFFCKKIDFINSYNSIDDDDIKEDISTKTTDQIVIEGINSIDSSSLDKKKLIQIYNNLG